jgi:hypothetical protein
VQIIFDSPTYVHRENSHTVTFRERRKTARVRKSSCLIEIVKSKGKAIPLKTWTCPEVSRRLRFPD